MGNNSPLKAPENRPRARAFQSRCLRRKRESPHHEINATLANSGRITGLTFGNQATTIRVCPATKRIASPSQKIDIVAVNEQGALQRFGYYQHAVDGGLGPMRRNALANYQRDHNLAITGAIDPQRLTSLGFIA